jgi:hypothetical protein
MKKFLTTFTSYGAVARDRQGEILRVLAAPQQVTTPAMNELADVVVRKLLDSGIGVQAK